MSLAVASLWISIFWLVVYALKHSARRSKFILPLSHNRRPSTELAVKNLNLRLKTERLNAYHDELSTWLALEHSRTIRQTLIWIYDLGCLASTVGMLVAFGILVRMVAMLSMQALHTTPVVQHNATLVVKRGLTNVLDAVPDAASVSRDVALRINPIIPGITVPLHHLPVILLALCVSQVVHEAGHAVTAALHRIPMLSCGVAVTFILPSAFVTLPSARLEKLLPHERMQIMSGGCFHNFAFLCLLLFTAWSGLTQLPMSLIFQDVSALGKLVVSVDYDSPLAIHIPVNSLITKVDDVPMVYVPPEDPWDRYLLSPSSGYTQGWCVNNSILTQAHGCTSTGFQSCFISKEDETTEYGLDPVPIFTDGPNRCNSSSECTSSSECVVPRKDQQLVRITLTQNYGGKSTEGMLVWKGPKEEIWEQVEVDHLRPRFAFVSHRLRRMAFTFFDYMKIANLSLYLVNLLPISALDGYQFLSALLQFMWGWARTRVESVDLEAHGSRTLLASEAWMRRSRAFLSISAIMLVALCALLGIINKIIE